MEERSRSSGQSSVRFNHQAGSTVDEGEPLRKRARRDPDDVVDRAGRSALSASDCATLALSCGDLCMQASSDSSPCRVTGVDTALEGLLKIALSHSKATRTVVTMAVHPVPTRGFPTSTQVVADDAGRSGTGGAVGHVGTSLTAPALAQATAAALAVVDTGCRGNAALLCGLCSDFLHLPTTIHCGHSFCSGCLDRHWSKKSVKLEQSKRATAAQTTAAATSSVQSDDSKLEIECPAIECDMLFHRPDVQVNTKLSSLLNTWFPQDSLRVAHRWRAEAELEDGDVTTALEYLNLGLDIDPNDFTLRRLRVRAHLRHCRLAAAISDANQCCDLHPLLADSFACRALVRVECEQHQEAMTDYLHTVTLLGSVTDELKGKLNECMTKVIDNETSSSRGGELSPRSTVLLLQRVLAAALEEASTAHAAPPKTWAVVAESERSMDDVGCAVCLNLFYQPVTVPCGHMLCRPCLDRCVDNQQRCPSCRSDLVAFQQQHTGRSVTRVVDYLLRTYATNEYEDRAEQHRLYIERVVSGSGSVVKMPVFICMLVLPASSHVLRVFEPQYLLMIRRCFESSTRRFGMCLPSRRSLQDGSPVYVDYGTEVTITEMKQTGASEKLVTVSAGRRYHVLDREMCDGYNVAAIEWVSDMPEQGDEMQSLMSLHDEVYAMARDFFTTPESARAMLERLCGTLPEPPTTVEVLQANPDGPAWVWFCIGHLPLSEARKVEMLETTSLRSRLNLVGLYFNDNSTPSAKQGFFYYLYLKRSGY